MIDSFLEVPLDAKILDQSIGGHTIVICGNVDPVHFGIVLITNLTIAGITPPVGQMMFISSQVLHVPMEDYTIEVLPFLGAMLVVLFLLTAFPAITLWLPDLVYGVA